MKGPFLGLLLFILDSTFAANDGQNPPYHASIQAAEDESVWFEVCQAALLTEIWLLTAAQCKRYIPPNPVGKIRAVVGTSLDCQIRNYTDSRDLVYENENGMVPLYNLGEYLIKVEKPFKLTPNVQPVTLRKGIAIEGKILTFIATPPLSKMTPYFTVPDDEQVRNLIPSAPPNLDQDVYGKAVCPRTNDYQITKTMFCAISITGKRIPTNDDVASLLVDRDNVLVGFIVTYEYNSAAMNYRPCMFEGIDNYYDEIQNIINEAADQE